MFPLFHVGPYIEVHIFGLLLVSAWILFFWLLHKYSREQGVSKHIFSNIATYTLSILLWSRIFYIFTDWRNEKYIFIDLFEGGGILNFLYKFFITENYDFSLAGGIFGFLCVFFWYKNKYHVNFYKSIDIIVRSFYWAALLGYLGALLGGQIYGIYFDSFFSILYTDKNSIVPIGSARFPLPIIYMICTLIGGLLIEKLNRAFHFPDGFVGYIGIGFFGIVLFLGEFMNGSADMFTSFRPFLSLNQLFALIFIGFSLIGIIKSTKI